MLSAELRSIHAILKRIRHLSTHYAELLTHVVRVGKIALKAIDHVASVIDRKIRYRVLGEKQCARPTMHTNAMSFAAELRKIPLMFIFTRSSLSYSPLPILPLNSAAPSG